MKLMNIKKAVPISLGIIGYILLLEVLIFAESDHEGTSIESIGDAIWYSVVTLSTVGYGDITPVSVTGKVIGLIFVLGSVGILSALIGKVTDSITDIRERRSMGYNGTDMKNHVVIIGWDSFAKSIADILLQANRQVAIITDKKEDISFINEEFQSNKVFTLHSAFDNISFFKKANVQDSFMVFVNLSNDTDKLVAILNLRQAYPDPQYLVTLDQTNLSATFKAAGVSYVLSKNEIASKLIASYIFEPHVAHFNIDLLAMAKSEDDYDIQEYLVNEANFYINKSFGDAFFDIKKRYNVLLIGLSKLQPDNTYKIIKLPDDNTPIELGDYMIFLLDGRAAKKISQLFGVSEGYMSDTL